MFWMIKEKLQITKLCYTFENMLNVSGKENTPHYNKTN